MASSVLTIGVIIVVFVIIAGVIPYMYNSHVESGDTHSGYCASLAKQIESDKVNHLNASILVTEINLYHSSCSS